jgi:hypothetical protein
MINVGENYKVGADRLNVILYSKDNDKDPARVERMNKMWEKRGRPPKAAKVDDDDKIDDGEDKAEKGWKVEGYYSNVEFCLLALFRKEVNRSDLKDLQTVLDRINEAEKTIIKTLSEIPKEVVEEKVKGKI